MKMEIPSQDTGLCEECEHGVELFDHYEENTTEASHD